MFSTVQHIALIISSENNLWFYKLLGFKVVFRRERQYDTVVLMSGNGMELEVFIDPRHPSKATGIAEPFGLRHFALRIASGWTLEQEVERLKSETAKFLEIGPIMEDWTGYDFYSLKTRMGQAWK